MRIRLAILFVLLAAACSESPTLPDASVPVPRDAAVATDAGSEAADVGPGLDASHDAGRPEVKIKSVLPSRGPLAGGAIVTIEGDDFYEGFASGATDAKKSTRVYFGKNESAQIDLIDDGTMEVLVPPNEPGTVDVVVKNPNGTATCTGCFVYFRELTFTRLSPDRGVLEGGTEVLIEGSAFDEGTTVLFGSKASPAITRVDDGKLKVLVPPGDAAGPVDVRVFNKNGIGEIRRGYTYFPKPRIDRLEPRFGPLSGGTTRLVGATLKGATSVRFGGAEALFVPLDEGTLEVTVPSAVAAGPVDVTVETPLGNAVRPRGYVYFDPAATGLTLAGVWPTHGPRAGGGEVTVVGSGFDDATVFHFDGVEAVRVGPAAPNVVTVTVPAGTLANRWVDVKATGGVEVTLANGYHYNLGLSSLAPSSGTGQGGTVVTLTGEGFTDGLDVRFGGLAGTAVTVTAATILAATTPVGAGTVDVRVRDPADFENEAVLPGAFRFDEALTVGRVSPDTGAIAGGTYVSVLGTGFAEGTAVLFGASTLKDLKVVDSHTIVGRTPPANAGAVDLTVKRAGREDVAPSAFSYFDPTNGGGGSSGGPLDGTLNVTVLDSGLRYGQPLAGATVMLGVDPTTVFQGKTDRRGQITFSDPSLVKAQMVTASKDGYQTLTIAAQESQNVTVFLSSSQGATNPPDVSPPSASGNPAFISGHVSGFKLPRPLASHETEWAEVWVVPQSVYATPPFNSPVSPQVRDARGERWKVTTDGGAYTVMTGSGLRALYAVYGIYDRNTEAFTPVLMGIRRGINADQARPAVNQKIVLDIHLDQTVPVRLDPPVLVPGTEEQAPTRVQAWLELGAEGVIPVGGVTMTSPAGQLLRLPRVDGDALLFAARAQAVPDGPLSTTFRKQLGDLSKGVSIGPMLGLPRLTEPVESFAGRISWELQATPDADLARLDLARFSPLTGYYSSVWSVVLPGSQRSAQMPANLFAKLLSDATEDDQLYVSLTFSRAARFDYAYWSYGSFSQDGWTSWTQLSQSFPMFEPRPDP